MKQKNKKGFTLIELLVVVLIIGILAAVALPQYKKAVEKSKVSEALVNMDVIEGSLQRYLMARPNTGTVEFKNIADVELSGGNWQGDYYYTKDFDYEGLVNWSGYGIQIDRINSAGTYLYSLTVDASMESHTVEYICHTQLTDMGRHICKYLESQGWDYEDGEL